MGSFEQAMLNTAFGMNDTYAKALASYLFREVIVMPTSSTTSRRRT